MKKKYIGLGLLVLSLLLVTYHYFAASQAEDQITKAIAEQNKSNDSLSIQFTGLDIAPFAATVTLDDLTIISGNHIERAANLQLDMGYSDFLNIYFGGSHYGLKHLNEIKVRAIQSSYLDKSGMQEVKADTLHVHFTGSALDALQTLTQNKPLASEQTIRSKGSALTVSLPGTSVNRVVAEKFSYTTSFDAGQPNIVLAHHQISLDSLMWTPSENFQQQYSFFIKGFGYPTEAIPFHSANLIWSPQKAGSKIALESTIESELVLAAASGYIIPQTPFEHSLLEDMDLSLSEFSKSFSVVLQNIERLLDLKLSRQDNGIKVPITGTVSQPHLAK